MGIKGLTSLLKNEVPESLQIHKLNYFKGSKIAIDTSILLYKFRHNSNNEYSHISGLMNKCILFIKHGIIPIFVIDGKPPPEKDTCIKIRKSQRQKTFLKIQELKDMLEKDEKLMKAGEKDEIISKIKKFDKQIIRVTREHHKEAYDLLKLLGFMVIKSPGEAEEVCAFLQKSNIVDFTYSDDTDLIPLGCGKLLRSNGKSNTLTEVDLEKILKGLDFNLDQFIDLCILCGCDYVSNIPKIKHKEALKLIKVYKNLENVCTFLSSNGQPIPIGFDYKNARKIFKSENYKCLENFNKISNLPVIDTENLRSFLLNRHFNKYYINKYINKFNDSKLLIPRDNSVDKIKDIVYFKNK